MSPCMQGPSFCHADLIVDHSTGVVVHPLTVLSGDSGLHLVSTRATALSLQYQRLWIVLYAEPEKKCVCVCVCVACVYFTIVHMSPHVRAY